MTVEKLQKINQQYMKALDSELALKNWLILFIIHYHPFCASDVILKLENIFSHNAVVRTVGLYKNEVHYSLCFIDRFVRWTTRVSWMRIFISCFVSYYRYLSCAIVWFNFSVLQIAKMIGSFQRILLLALPALHIKSKEAGTQVVRIHGEKYLK